jgi:hypothetical protein
MPFANITGMTVGQDLRLVMFTPVSIVGGVAVPTAGFSSDQLGRLAGFNATPVISEVSGVPLDNGGVRIVRNIYQGWNGDIDFMRYNGNLSLLMASIMGIFNQLGNETYFQIDAVVYNVITQTTDTYTFQNCVISQVDLGRFGETGRVDQRLHFEGQNILVNGNVLSALPGLMAVNNAPLQP